MDNAAANLAIVISARDEASAKIQQLQGTLNKVTEGAGIVSGAMVGVGVAVAAASAYSIKLATDFQSAMNLLQTQAGASSQEVDKMKSSVLQLSTQVGTAPADLAKGLFFIESAGYRGAQALDILKLSAEGAKVGQADLGQTANVLTTVMTSGIKGVKNASDAMGALNATVGAGKMKMQDLVDAMSTGILPSAKSAGISIQQLGATLAVMSNNGVPAVDAASRLRMTIGLMVDPSSQATKALESMGMQSTQLAKDMQSGGIVKAIEDLHDHLKGLSAVAQEQALGKMFGAREGSTIMTLVGNVDQLQGRLNQINNTGGNFGSAWKKTSDEAGQSFSKLMATLQVLAIQWGNILLPVVTKFVNFLANNLIPFVINTTKFFEQHKLALVALAGVVGGILTMSVIAFTIAMAPAVIAVGAFIIAFLPFILLGAAIVAAVALVIVYWKQLQAVGQVVFTAIGTFFTNLGKTVSGVVSSIIQDVKNMVDSIIDHINGLIHGINNVGGKIGLSAIKIPDIPKFDQGGYVPQTGLAVVHQGEFVLSKDMIAGRQSIPSQIANTTNNNTPINIYATVNQEMDMNLLGQKIAFAVRNSR